MRERPSLVSIIIPAYNAGLFIEETIQSIYNQSYRTWEVIVVNDGSTDNTNEVLRALHDLRINIINQENAGVAAARNRGLELSRGEFVVFFDADDLMSPDFLASRVEALQKDASVGFVGGTVHTFPLSSEKRRAAANDPENEILFFNASCVTVPSNYMFRKSILVDHSIEFNRELSSTADRMFILELSKHTTGKNIQDEKGGLLYRLTPESMSNNVTSKLIQDNERFYYELKRRDLLPGKGKQKFKSLYFLSLAKGFGMVKQWNRVSKYLLMSFVNHPIYFIRNFIKRITTFRSARVIRMNG
jgi:teichuronic acid biosynthesis glycosyltransferase TuaG